MATHRCRTALFPTNKGIRKSGSEKTHVYYLLTMRIWRHGGHVSSGAAAYELAETRDVDWELSRSVISDVKLSITTYVLRMSVRDLPRDLRGVGVELLARLSCRRLECVASFRLGGSSTRVRGHVDNMATVDLRGQCQPSARLAIGHVAAGTSFREARRRIHLGWDVYVASKHLFVSYTYIRQERPLSSGTPTRPFATSGAHPLSHSAVPPPPRTVWNHSCMMRFVNGWGRSSRGSSPPHSLPALVTTVFSLCFCIFFFVALPRPAAADCPGGDVLLSGADCLRLCSTSLFPCTSPFGKSCGSWFWRRTCCRSSAVRTCTNGRTWANCYCDVDSVRPAGIVLLVAAALGALVGIAALFSFLVRRRKARAAVVPPVYGTNPTEGSMPPPPPPPVHGGYPGYPPPADYPGWGGGGPSGGPPPGYPGTSVK